MRTLGLSILLAAVCALPLHAQDKEATKSAAIALVNKAAAFVKASGVDKAIAEISNPESKFVDGEMYVFAYDLEGVMKAHPKNAKLIGKNLLEVPDVDGKLFRKDIIAAAKGKGSGWVDYKYKNPESGKVEDKTTYVLKEGALVLCCGIYR